MSLPLDHVVILVADLEQAITDYGALGFTVQRGGSHADGATHNALIGFADGSYLELIAFLRPQAEHRWGGWAARGYEGFVDFALLPPAVGAVVAGARSRGLDFQGPFDGGRTRPDGQELRWQTGTPPSPDLPFLCGDLTPRAWRVREGEVRVHANGTRGIASATVLVHDLQASLLRYQALLDIDRPPPPVLLAGLGLRQAMLPLGPSTLLLLAAGADSELPAAAAVRQLLATHGEGLIGLSLHGPTSAMLSRQRCHGAAIELQGD